MSITSKPKTRKIAKISLKNLGKSMVFMISIGIAFPLLSASSAQASAPTLINYYQFEGNGIDSAGGPTATLFGSNGFGTGKYGSGYVSNGAFSGYLDMGTNVGLFGAQDFTLGFWFNSPHGSGHLINKRIDSLHFITFQLDSSGRIDLELRGNSPSLGNIFIAPVSSISGLNDGAWHHMAIVRSGSILSLYVDGQLSTIDNGIGDLDFNDPAYNTANFIFGGTNQYPGLSFFGSLDDLQIYSGALTQSQISGSMITPFVAKKSGDEEKEKKEKKEKEKEKKDKKDSGESPSNKKKDK